MGTFHIRCRLENIVDRKKGVVVPKLLVDTGSEYTWVPAATLEKIGVQREKKDAAFVTANGQQITRSVGFAILRVDKQFTVDEVVFGEPGDLSLLGARTLEGLNLRVDSRLKKPIAAGPLPAASGTRIRGDTRPGGADVLKTPVLRQQKEVAPLDAACRLCLRQSSRS